MSYFLSAMYTKKPVYYSTFTTAELKTSVLVTKLPNSNRRAQGEPSQTIINLYALVNVMLHVRDVIHKQVDSETFG